VTPRSIIAPIFAQDTDRVWIHCAIAMSGTQEQIAVPSMRPAATYSTARVTGSVLTECASATKDGQENLATPTSGIIARRGFTTARITGSADNGSLDPTGLASAAQGSVASDVTRHVPRVRTIARVTASAAALTSVSARLDSSATIVRQLLRVQVVPISVLEEEAVRMACASATVLGPEMTAKRSQPRISCVPRCVRIVDSAAAGDANVCRSLPESIAAPSPCVPETALHRDHALMASASVLMDLREIVVRLPAPLRALVSDVLATANAPSRTDRPRVFVLTGTPGSHAMNSLRSWHEETLAI